MQGNPNIVIDVDAASRIAEALGEPLSTVVEWLKEEHPSKPEPSTVEPWQRTKGFYVYAWYADGELIYIGKGKGSRVIQTTHNSLAQSLRSKSSNWRYDILEDGMTESMALRVESCLIRLMKPKANVKGTNSKFT